jgi:unsaturated rhamnogalacturonyl hydrolase
MLRKVADRVLVDFLEPPPFNWGEGVLMAGMMRAGEVTRDVRYVNFVKGWADHWRHESIRPVLERKGYCGHWGPAYPVVMLYHATGESIYLSMANEVLTFMQTRATRTTDGGLGHWRDNYQLWVDTLFMSCPVYAEMGAAMNRPEYLTEATRQLNISSNHLQDKRTGLFYHMYDEPEDRRTREFWGRGNGWTAMAYISVLRHLEPDHPQYKRVASDFRRLAKGLISTQDSLNGLYHTVLNRPESYAETSCSAMILYSLIEGQRLGLITIDDPAFFRRTWTGLTSKVDHNGVVFDVSAGTDPADHKTYGKISLGTETWGTGAFLLAASSLVEYPLPPETTGTDGHDPK